jgi:hypothetical protein
MERLPDVTCEPGELAAALEAFGIGGADPLEEYRRWLLDALRVECVKRRRATLQATAVRDTEAQVRAYAEMLPPQPGPPPDLNTPGGV